MSCIIVSQLSRIFAPFVLLIATTATVTLRPITVVVLASSSVSGTTSLSGNNNGRSTENSISPVRHLQESLAASAAHGTVVAVCAGIYGSGNDEIANVSFTTTSRPNEKNKDKEDEECVVILSQSPSASLKSNLTLSSWNVGREEGDDHEEEKVEYKKKNCRRKGGQIVWYNRLIPLPPGPLSSSSLVRYMRGAAGSMIEVLHDGAIVAVTGLASDARHLIRCAALESLRHWTVMGSHMPAKKIVVNALVGRMSAAAMEGGGRPYGAQALVIGRRGGSNTGRVFGSNNVRVKGRRLQMYTVDPSGGWMHWGGPGTAVGKNAEFVRRRLAAVLLHSCEQRDAAGGGVKPGLWKHGPKTPVEALEVGMKAALEAAAATGVAGDAGNVSGSKQFHAIIMYASGSRQCASFHPRQIEESYQRCMQKIISEQTESGKYLTSIR